MWKTSENSFPHFVNREREGELMAIRMIALDLDRTTLDYEGRLSEENRKALELLIRQGIFVIPASGRSLDSFPIEILEMPGLEYVITSNGAAVYRLSCREGADTESGKSGGTWETRGSQGSSGRASAEPMRKVPVCLQRFLLRPAMVRKVMELTGGEGITYETFVEGKAYADPAYVSDPTAFGAVREAVPYIQRTRTPVEKIREFILEHEDCLDSIDVIVGDPEKKKALMELLRAQCREIYLTTSVEQLIEISDRKAGKHSGIRFLQEYLGILPEETAAFGDADNDAEMLREAGIGIAVRNASPVCKAAADAVTLFCEENGVAYGIREILRLAAEYADTYHGRC